MTTARLGTGLLLPGTLLIMALGSLIGCGEDDPAIPQETAIFQDVSTTAAHALIEQRRGDPSFVILDVRTQEEYAAGHLDDAILIDYYSADFTAQLDELEKNRAYLIYCRSGNRSAGAREVMRGLGFREVYTMLGGIDAWQADGFPVVE